MNPNDQANERGDTWDLLAQELLGEEAEPTETGEASSGAASEEAVREGEEEALSEPEQRVEEFPPAPPLGEDEAVSPAAPVSDAAQVFAEPEQQEEEIHLEQPVEPSGEDAAVAEESSPDTTSQSGASFGTELPLERESADSSAADESGEPEPQKEKPRRTRRGRRHRSRRTSDEPAEAAVETEPLAGDGSEFEAQFETIDDGEDIDEGEDADGSSAKSDAKSKAIPTWAEAISYLSRGPEPGSSKKDAGARPRRRRRRGRPPQS